jgi:hypothetical protein
MSLGQAAKGVADRASAIVRLELELAAMELKRKVVALGLGIALALVGLLLLLYGLGFALAGAAAGIETALPAWASLLIVAGGLVLVSLTLVALGVVLLRKGVPPVPEQAIEEAKLTTAALKGNGHA